MSSYFPSFSYTAPNGIKYNSYKDKNLIVTHFESGDDGEMDTFLGMEPVYSDNSYGTRRFDYGAKYNNVAVIRISVMKANGKDFTVAEVRDFLRWTTGSRKTSYLDLVDGEIIKASFLGRVTAVYQQKLDARTIGFVIEHTSISPYAYSPIQYASCYFGQALTVNDSGVLFNNGHDLFLDENGILSNGHGGMFDIENDGTLYIDNSVGITILNDTDDLSDYVYMDLIFTNTNSDHLIIKNQTLYEESDETDGITEITGMHNKEIITLDSRQFITSSSGRMFGSNFNFIWPKLLPGENNFIISGSGEGTIEFSYRYPIKIGDCAIDIYVSGGGLCCGDYSNESISGPVTWDDILGKPTTLQGYGVTNAYTKTEIDSMLDDFVSDDVYTKSEVDTLIESAQISIDEYKLNAMLSEILGGDIQDSTASSAILSSGILGRIILGKGE